MSELGNGKALIMNNVNIFENIRGYSYEELEELKKEIFSLLLLDKEKIAGNESVRFIKSKHSILPLIIDIVEVIDDVLKRLEQQGDTDSIIEGIVQLIKIDSLIVGNLQAASFYENWKSNGYIAQIEMEIKLSY